MGGVPKEIRDVDRPVNTVVVAYGKNKDKWAVRQRFGCKSVNGRKIPIEGPIIGHIVNMKYVPITDIPGIAMSETDYKRWADVKLCIDNTQDILEDLLKVYNTDDSLKAYCIAVLRALDPDINDYELDDEYDETWLSVSYPGVALSKNTVSDFIYDLGRTCSRIVEFMQIRVEKVTPDHRIAVDGTLKSDESSVNTFSDYSRKALKKGTRDISIIFAYDITTGEPICSKAYPGNQVDVATLEDFITTNDVKSGIIIADKGFSYNAARKVFSDRPDLHFMIPLKRDAAIIKKYKMYDYNMTLKEYPGMTCRKEKTTDGKYLYSFHEVGRASREEITWTKDNDDYDPQELNELRKEFGSIVFLSDVDMSLLDSYRAYEERWFLETLFMFYKDILKMDQTRVHEDCSVIGTEFINFLSVLITYRLIKIFKNVEQLKGVPYNTILKKLKRVTKIRGPDGKWSIRKITEKEKDLMVELGVFPRLTEIKNPRGRPAKKKDDNVPAKRRGRPPKNPKPDN